MAEILTWKYDYEPIENKWTVIHCENFQDVLNFLRPQSIILISQKEYNEKANYLFFNLVRLAFSQSEIIFVDHVSFSDLNEKINSFVRRKFEPTDKVADLQNTFECLVKMI